NGVVMSRRVSRFNGSLTGIVLAASMVIANTANAEVTLMEKDGWTVFTQGRVQTFFNYTQGDGFHSSSTGRVDPTTGQTVPGVIDGHGNTVPLWGGGARPRHGLLDAPSGEGGEVKELRLRTGFVGNVLGFGIKRKVSDSLEIQGYYAITALITTNGRRKYLTVPVDARETHATVLGPWGSLR